MTLDLYHSICCIIEETGTVFSNLAAQASAILTVSQTQSNLS